MKWLTKTSKGRSFLARNAHAVSFAFHPFKMNFLLAIIFALAACISAIPQSPYGPRTAALGKRQNSENGFSSLVVDLGYEQYQGMVDASTGLKTWKGYVYLSS